MNNDELKSFLKSRSSEVPPAPLGEAAATWKKIEDGKGKNKLWYWAFLPLITASLFVLISIQQTKQLQMQNADEDFMYQEWSEFSKDVDSDVDFDTVVLGK